MASLWSGVANWARRSWLHVVLLFVFMLGFSVPLVMVVLLTTQEDPSPIVEELFASVEGCTDCRALQRRVDALLASEPNIFLRGGAGQGSRSVQHLTVPKLLNIICISGDTLPIRGGVAALAGGNCTALVKRLHAPIVDYIQSWKPEPNAGSPAVSLSSSMCPLFPPAVVVGASTAKLGPATTGSSSTSGTSTSKRKNKLHNPSSGENSGGSGAAAAGGSSANAAAAARCLSRQLQFLDSGTGPICYESCEGRLRVVDWAVVRTLRYLAYPSMRMFGAYVREFGGSVVLLLVQGFLVAFILQMRVYHNVLRARVAAAVSLVGGKDSAPSAFVGGVSAGSGNHGQHRHHASARDEVQAAGGSSTALRAKSGGVGGAAATTASLSASHRGKR